MPFVNVAIKDAKEPELVPEGEYDLEIVGKKAFDDNGNSATNPTDISRIGVTIRIDSADHPNAEFIYHTLWMKGKEEFHVSSMRDVRRFLSVFSVPFEGNGFDIDDLDEATGRCVVYQKEGDDGIIRPRLRLPRFRGEEQEAPKSGRRTAAPVAKGRRGR